MKKTYLFRYILINFIRKDTMSGVKKIQITKKEVNTLIHFGIDNYKKLP